MQKFRCTLGLALIGAFFSITGCAFNGGGHLPSADGSGDKATFAIHGTLAIDEDFNITANGSGQYNDHGLKMKVHLEVTDEALSGIEDIPEELESCIDDLDPDIDEDQCAIVFGTYRPQPKKAGPGGLFIAVVCDVGEPGVDDDLFGIILIDGVYDGYLNCGFIEGGNIQVKPSDD